MNNLRKLQLIELEILKYFLKICSENKLKYYMLGGTLLGAVRHEGFIPWDDDIDIGMPRNDYEKFLEIMSNKNNTKFVVDNFRNNRDSLIYITRLENSQIKIKDKSASIEKERNAWIDIFPLDGMPNNVIGRNFHKIHLLFLRMLFKYSVFSKFVNQKQKYRPLHEKLLIKLGQIFNFEKILSKKKALLSLDKAMRKYDFENSKFIVNFMGAYKFKEMFNRQIYDNIEFYNFENIKICGPRDYDAVLKQLYGNYMEEPIDKNHHCTEFEE